MKTETLTVVGLIAFAVVAVWILAQVVLWSFS